MNKTAIVLLREGQNTLLMVDSIESVQVTESGIAEAITVSGERHRLTPPEFCDLADHFWMHSVERVPDVLVDFQDGEFPTRRTTVDEHADLLPFYLRRYGFERDEIWSSVMIFSDGLRRWILPMTGDEAERVAECISSGDQTRLGSNVLMEPNEAMREVDLRLTEYTKSLPEEVALDRMCEVFHPTRVVAAVAKWLRREAHGDDPSREMGAYELGLVQLSGDLSAIVERMNSHGVAV